jgi:lysophospholipase L1-like esterase
MTSLQPRRPSVRSRLLSGLLVAAVVLAGVEGALRLVLGPPRPAVEVHVLGRAPERYFTLEEGSLRPGYLPPHERLELPLVSEAPRFAVLGGSSVHEGRHGVGREREFTQHAADLLGVQGLNLGAPGLDSFDLVRMLHELLPSSLDALVVYAGHNDLGNVAMGRRRGGLARALELRGQAGLERLQLYWLLARALCKLGNEPPRQGRPEPLSDSDRAMALRHFEANVEHMLWQAEGADLPVVLVVPVSRLTEPPEVQPCDEPACPASTWRRGMALRERDPAQASALLRRARDLDRLAIRAPSALQERLRQLAVRDGVSLLDAPAVLPWEPGLEVPAGALFSDHLHLSAEGHRALGERLAETLAPLLELPSSSTEELAL